jgi:hypothetical protein
MRVLVDSSVWIDHLRGVRTRETAILGSLLAWLDPELEPGDGKAPANVLVGDFVLAKGPLRVHRLGRRFQAADEDC